MFVIPDDFVRKASAFHGEEGLAWVKRLPAILANCEQRWRLTFAPPFAYQSYAYHYIAPATRSDGTAVVVKVHAPTNEFTQEAEALRLCEGRGMVRLLDYDRNDKALLLERLEPGTALSELEDDDEATSQAAAVMRQLWRPVPPVHPFPSVIDWGRGFLRLRQRYKARRVDLLAEMLDLDRARVRNWAMAQAVLSAWWIIEDSSDNWEDQIACAELLAAIKP